MMVLIFLARSLYSARGLESVIAKEVTSWNQKRRTVASLLEALEAVREMPRFWVRDEKKTLVASISVVRGSRRRIW